MQNRRNILTLLGLATAATPVIAGDDVATSMFFPEESVDPKPGDFTLRRAHVDHVRMAAAMRNMADALDKGQIGIIQFSTSSVLKGGGQEGSQRWLCSRLEFEIELLKDNV